MLAPRSTMVVQEVLAMDDVRRSFRDRVDAGQVLAARVPMTSESIVLGLPRGGVPVAAEVARPSGARLDVFVARKVGAPGQPEFGIGAVAEGGEVVLTADAQRVGFSADELDRAVSAAVEELDRRVASYRGQRPVEVAGRDVVVVDDGLATGVTAEAALRALARRAPSRLRLAVPVCPPQSADRLSDLCDEVVAVLMPRSLRSVSAWYDDFTQTTDAEVRAALAATR